MTRGESILYPEARSGIVSEDTFVHVVKMMPGGKLALPKSEGAILALSPMRCATATWGGRGLAIYLIPSTSIARTCIIIPG